MALTSKGDALQKYLSLREEKIPEFNSFEVDNMRKRLRMLAPQVSEELGQVSSYVMGELTDLENSKTAGQIPESHTQLARAFNNVSQLVTEDILASENFAEGRLAMDFWIQVLKDREAANDFHTAFAIFGALNSTPIFRLKVLRNGLSEENQRYVEEFQAKNGIQPVEQYDRMMKVSDLNMIPYHGAIKSILDKSLPSKLAENAAILEKAKQHHQAKNKNRRFSVLQKGLIVDAPDNKKVEDAQFQRSLYLEPRNKQQLYFEKNEKRHRIEEQIRAYANLPSKDSSDKELDRVRKQEVLDILRNLQSLNEKNPHARSLYLQGIVGVQPQAGRLRSQTRLQEHHRGLMGIVRKARNIDTTAMRMLKELHASIIELEIAEQQLREKDKARAMSAPVALRRFTQWGNQPLPSNDVSNAATNAERNWANDRNINISSHRHKPSLTISADKKEQKKPNLIIGAHRKEQQKPNLTIGAHRKEQQKQKRIQENQQIDKAMQKNSPERPPGKPTQRVQSIIKMFEQKARENKSTVLPISPRRPNPKK